MLISYDYPGKILQYEMRLWSRPRLFNITEGAAIYGENGWLLMSNTNWKAYDAKGKQVDESLKYVKWLTEKEQEQTFMEIVPLIPANPAAMDPAKIAPQLKLFADITPNIQKIPAQISKPVDEAIRKGVQSILLKEKNIDQVLADMDKAQKE